MTTFDSVEVYDIPIGHFCTDFLHVWESVRSGDVYKESFAPNMAMMRCAYVIDEDKASFKVGSITEDYFKSKFLYLGDIKTYEKTLPHLITWIKENNGPKQETK